MRDEVAPFDRVDVDDAAPAIAIVGMAGRFPGAESLDALWDLLEAGGSTLERLDRDALIRNGRNETEMAAPGFVPVGGYMRDVRRFDAQFFGYTPREAAFMDPQLRAMLETAWHVFEDAGVDPARAGERTGVFASMKISSYLLKNLPLELARGGVNMETLCVTMNGQDYVATWIAYKLGLTGPAMNVQTACSSGLANVVVACRHLDDHSCDAALAIAGAVTVPQGRGYVAEPDSIVSTDGVCRPFDADANGTIFADGVAGVLLKRLEDALDDGDRIVAVIRGFALNNDGQRKVSYSAPSVDGQAEAVAEALAMSGLDPSDVDFIEAHGTGTHLGDPIEFAAFDRIYGSARRKNPIVIGAIKASIGHTAEASGMAGLIKAAMCVDRGRILPHPTFRTFNPHISARADRFRVATAPEPWPQHDAPRRAAVSSLGFGGTNSHVVLEQAPSLASPKTGGVDDGPHVLVLSARSRDALEKLRDRYLGRLAGASDEETQNICATSWRGRAQMPWRLAVSGAGAAELRRALVAAAPPRKPVPPTPRLAIVFGGHGPESLRSAREMADRSPEFREVLEAGLAALGGDAPPVRALLLEGADISSAEPPAAQSAIVLQGCAAARVWRSQGYRPDIVIGHSLGELAAAESAGVVDLSDAVSLAWARGEAMLRNAPAGAMLALALPEAEAAAMIDGSCEGGSLALSGVNGVRQCVASGDVEAIERLRLACAEAGVTARRLGVPFAFHSPAMTQAARAFAEAARRTTFRAAKTPLVSTVSGALDDGSMGTPDYWPRQMLAQVRFRDAVLAAAAEGVTAFLEVSAHTLYAFAARATLDAAGGDAAWIGSFGSDLPGPASVAAARAQLFMADFSGNEPPRPRRRAALPLYPFAETRFWIDPPETIAPARDNTRAAETGVPPPLVTPSPEEETDPLLEELAAIWRDRIGGEVGLDDDFFALGGNSLVALSILSDLELGLGVRPPLSSFLEARTVRGLAQIVERLVEHAAPVG